MMKKRADNGSSVRLHSAEENEIWNDDDRSILADLVRRLWVARAWFIYPALVGVLLSVVALAIINFASPSTTSYRFAISLTMPGAANGKYANGLPYAPSDLRSASVLSEVFRRNNLDRYGLDTGKFSAMVSSEAYSPVQESITERYRGQLSARNITPEERQRIGEEFAVALRNAASDGALVTFTVPDDFNIPREVGLKVVADIPAAWSDIYVNVLGAGSSAMARSESTILDGDYAKTLDYPLAYDYAVIGLRRLIDRLKQIAEQPGASNVVLSAKNVTALDIMSRAERIRDVEMGRILRPIVDTGLSRDKALTSLSYENTLKQLEDDERLALKRADIVSTIVREGGAVSELPGGSGGAPAAIPDGAAPQPGFMLPGSSVTSIPQFGDVFIDRIVAMALSGAGAEFRQELLRQKLQLSEEAANLAKDRVEIERRLASIRNAEDRPESPQVVERFKSGLDAVVDNINELWADANGILETIGTRNLSSDRQIYSSLPLTRPVASTAFWRSPYLLIGALGAVVALGLLGLALRELREMLRRRRDRQPG